MHGSHLKQLKANLALLAVAFVWGVTFVVVQDALADITPHYFNAVRFTLAFIFLYLIYRRRFKKINRTTALSGIFIGLFLFSGYAFQTVGLQYTSAANAGFITGLAVVLVPIFTAVMLRRLPAPSAVFGVTCAAIGLSLLTLSQGLSGISSGDILIFLCAVGFALHIIMVGKYAPFHDSVQLSLTQIATVAAASLLFGIAAETPPTGLTKAVWLALLITAIPATALAYLVQNTVQKYTSPTHTAIIFTMEPVFAALTAFLLKGEVLTMKQLIGCGLILAGMLAAELCGGESAETSEA